MVSLLVNGEALEFEAEPTVEELLSRLGVPLSAVAVEVNQVIVPRALHASRRLARGDQIEVVTFVGGG